MRSLQISRWWTDGIDKKFILLNVEDFVILVVGKEDKTYWQEIWSHHRLNLRVSHHLNSEEIFNESRLHFSVYLLCNYYYRHTTSAVRSMTDWMRTIFSQCKHSLLAVCMCKSATRRMTMIISICAASPAVSSVHRRSRVAVTVRPFSRREKTLSHNEAIRWN